MIKFLNHLIELTQLAYQAFGRYNQWFDQGEIVCHIMSVCYLLKPLFDQRLAARVMSVKKGTDGMCLARWSPSRVGHRDRKFNAKSDFMPTAAKRLTTKGKYCFRVEMSLSSVLVAKSSRLRRCRQY